MSLVKNPKHTTTMLSRLPLWRHGFGKLAHPTPGSCFGGSSKGGAEGFSIVLLCGGEKN
jgi:hypothetical protein